LGKWRIKVTELIAAFVVGVTIGLAGSSTYTRSLKSTLHMCVGSIHQQLDKRMVATGLTGRA
jgi:hypothetical protein